jgi:hypothetical protein
MWRKNDVFPHKVGFVCDHIERVLSSLSIGPRSKAIKINIKKIFFVFTLKRRVQHGGIVYNSRIDGLKLSWVI